MLAERADQIDRFGRVEADVQEHQVSSLAANGTKKGISIRMFFRLDALTVQDQRQEMTNLRVFVDNMAQRQAPEFIGAAGCTTFANGGSSTNRILLPFRCWIATPQDICGGRGRKLKAQG